MYGPAIYSGGGGSSFVEPTAAARLEDACCCIAVSYGTAAPLRRPSTGKMMWVLAAGVVHVGAPRVPARLRGIVLGYLFNSASVWRRSAASI